MSKRYTSKTYMVININYREYIVEANGKTMEAFNTLFGPGIWTDTTWVDLSTGKSGRARHEVESEISVTIISGDRLDAEFDLYSKKMEERKDKDDEQD